MENVWSDDNKSNPYSKSNTKIAEEIAKRKERCHEEYMGWSFSPTMTYVRSKDKPAPVIYSVIWRNSPGKVKEAVKK